MFGEPSEDSGNLRRCLPFSENHFRHACAQRAVMIDLSETEIFERKMTQARDGIVWSQLAFANLVKKLANGFGVQRALSSQHSAFSRAEF